MKRGRFSNINELKDYLMNLSDKFDCCPVQSRVNFYFYDCDNEYSFDVTIPFDMFCDLCGGATNERK